MSAVAATSGSIPLSSATPRASCFDPGRLDPATSLRFVQLTIPQTGPREQLAILRWVV